MNQTELNKASINKTGKGTTSVVPPETVVTPGFSP